MKKIAMVARSTAGELVLPGLLGEGVGEGSKSKQKFIRLYI